MMIRDSGYATSDRLEEPLATQPPPLTTFSPSSLLTQYFSLATSHHYPTTNDHGHDPSSTDSLVSAVIVRVGYGPDYLKMDCPHLLNQMYPTILQPLYASFSEFYSWLSWFTLDGKRSSDYWLLPICGRKNSQAFPLTVLSSHGLVRITAILITISILRPTH